MYYRRIEVALGFRDEWSEKFRKIGGKIPTIVHGHTTVRGVDDCLKYIDKTFGKMVPGGYLFSIYPHDFTSSNSTRYCNLFVNDMLPWSFYPYLLYQQTEPWPLPKPKP